MAAAWSALALMTGSTIADIPEIPEAIYSVEVSSDLVATVRAELPESRSVGAEFLDPSYQPIITLSEPGVVSVSFIDEGAGYRNSLAWVSLPENSLVGIEKSDLDLDNSGVVSLTELSAIPGMEYGLVFPNVSRVGGGGQLIPGDTIDIDSGREFQAGTQIVFCLLQNAWVNGSVEGFDVSLESTTSMYTADLINPESSSDSDINTDSSIYRSRHVAMLFSDESRTRIIMGFEDLHRTDRNYNDYRISSDEDFNDAVFVVSSTPPEAISDADIAEADPAFNPRPDTLFDNPDCCGVDTTSILDEQLPERTNVNASFLNPAYATTLLIDQTTFLVLSFIGEGAIYQNSLGYITYPEGALDQYTFEYIDSDNDGLIEPFELRALPNVETGMVFAHASVAGGGGALEPTEAVLIGDRDFYAGHQVDFFLVQDGWNDDGTVKDYTQDTGEATLTFYTIDRLNPEQNPIAQRHVAMMFTDDSFQSVLLGFEDLHRTDRTQNPVNYESDEDFNDNVFCISPIEFGAIANSNIPVANTGCPVDLNQDDVLNYFDIVLYLERFTSNDPLADLNNDGELNFFDLLVLIDAFANGCDAL